VASGRSASGHELPAETYLWQVRSAPDSGHRYDCVQTMIVRYRWLQAPQPMNGQAQIGIGGRVNCRWL
jgi:hypothetical protein